MLIKDFFRNSEFLDGFALKHLSHIRPNWELSWNKEMEQFEEVEDSFAKEINDLISELETVSPPVSYHVHEDNLAEYVMEHLGWNIEKRANKWTNAEYRSILDQGGFGDVNQQNLLKAIAGRIHKAIELGQSHFDVMGMGHMEWEN